MMAARLRSLRVRFPLTEAGSLVNTLWRYAFDLALHPWWGPLERLSALAAARGVRLVTPRMGERVAVGEAGAYPAWWRALASPAGRFTASPREPVAEETG